MTNTYGPQLLKYSNPSQIVNSIYYWIDQTTWAPGIAFPAGPNDPTTDVHDKDFFFNTTVGHLKQYQTNQWVDLGTTANAITSCGTTVPGSGTGNNFDLFNKYDSGEIYQKINGVWRNVGSNKNGLPLSADAINFTDSDKPWRSVNLGLIMVRDDGDSPLLATDQGLIVKKDIGAGGFLSSNQGALLLGSGLNNADDVPKIMLMHTGTYGTQDKLYLKQFDGSPAHLDLGNLTAHGNITDSGYLDAGSIKVGGTEIVNSGRGLANVTANASIITAGVFGTARLGSGTASSSTFLRGDRTWATLPTAQWTAGTVTVVTSPLFIGTDSRLYMSQAGNNGTGYLTSADWNIFNNKYDSGDSPSFATITVTDHLVGYTGTLNLQGHLTLTHTDSLNVILNANASGKDVVVKLESAGTLYGDLSYAANSNMLILRADGTGTTLNLYGSTIHAKNDFVCEGQLVVKGSEPVLLMQNSAGTTNLIELGFDEQGTYDSVYLNVRPVSTVLWLTTYNQDIILAPGYLESNGGAGGGNLRLYGNRSFNPQSADTGIIGAYDCYWHRIYNHEFYCYQNGDWYNFYDAYDDIELVKQWGEKNPTLSDKYDQTKIKPDANDLFSMLKAHDEKTGAVQSDFFNLFSLSSFALGCAKALAKKHDEHQETVSAMYSEMEQLREKVIQLETKLASTATAS